ncbi:MAG: DUF1786 family protein [Syntrophobacteraceae bacterium]
MKTGDDGTRYLLIDVGAGTMDVLYYDSGTSLHYKAVVKSPVPLASEHAAGLPGNLLLTGCEMGGGALSEVLRERARSSKVAMTASAAMTISHNQARVREWGIEVVDDDTAAGLAKTGSYRSMLLTDLPLERLEQIVTGFGVPFDFDVAAICAQDHGMPPENMSHLDYRHNLYKQHLDRNPRPESVLYEASEVPDTLNRLKSIAQTASRLPAREIFVMDSGFAAILGASMDRKALERDRILVLDIATSHTVGAALVGEELAGFFEYHTRDITLEMLEGLLRDLADGNLNHERILAEGGHGAYQRKAIGFENVQAIIATGPKRRLAESSQLPMTFGAPFGDNMMTGNVGMLEAIRRRKGLPPVTFL